MEIRALRPEDDRRAFSCGDPHLDDYFRRFAGQHQFRHHVGVTFIAREKALTLGYLTVSAGSLWARDLTPIVAHRLPAYPLPVLRLARLAVNLPVQKRGVGRRLLSFSFALAEEMAERVGCVGVTVDAKPDAVDFYRGLGLSPLLVESRLAGSGRPPCRMFAVLDDILGGDKAAGTDVARCLAEEFRRRAAELGLTPQELRAAAARLLDSPGSPADTPSPLG